MNLRLVLLVCSLAANAVLLVWLGRDAPESEVAAFGTTGGGKPAAGLSGTRPSAAPAKLDVATAEPAALRDQLRRLGLPNAAVEELVRQRIYANYTRRLGEMVADATRNLPLWRLTEMRYDIRGVFSIAQKRELADLERAARNEMLRVLGAEAIDRDGGMLARFSYLPPNKAILLSDLESDYATLARDLRDPSSSIVTVADREREKLLETEKERDLTALLSPEEREAFELRTSKTAGNLQVQMAGFDPTETEYKAIFQVRKLFEERFPLVPMAGMGLVQRARLEDQPDLMAQIKAALGEQRFAEYQTTTDFTYTALAYSGRIRWGLSTDTIREVATQVKAALNQSDVIGMDRSLSPADQKQQVIDLAAKTRAEVTARIGAAAADQYFRNMSWWRQMEEGAAIRLPTPSSPTLSVRRLGGGGPTPPGKK